MRFIICFIVIGLSLLMGACPLQEGELDIDIGDYEYHLETWNSQNMLDYQIWVLYWASSYPLEALITVRGGIPESSQPPEYITGQQNSTIPEFYSLIKVLEKNKRDGYGSGYSSLKVGYNTEYHYPSSIISKSGSYDGQWTTEWKITVMPLEEGDLDIDIGDYDNQLEAWNSQNMLDYRLKVGRPHGAYAYSSFGISAFYNVKNGIPEHLFSEHSRLKEATISGIYSFIKEEDERIRNVYNGINRPYLHVQYHPVCHYPILISSGVDFFYCRLYDRLEITITPGEPE